MAFAHHHAKPLRATAPGRAKKVLKRGWEGRGRVGEERQGGGERGGKGQTGAAASQLEVKLE